MRIPKLIGSFAAMALLALSLPLAGCGQAGPGPEEAVDTALTAIKAMDGKTLETVYAGGKLASGNVDVVGMLSAKDDVAMTTDVSSLSSSQKEYLAAVQKMLCGFDYTIDKAAVSGNAAKVTVTVKTYDFGGAYADGMKDFGRGFVTAVSNGTDAKAERTKVLIRAVEDEVRALEAKSKKKTVDLNVTRANGQWKVDELSKDQLDALFGGIVSAFR